MNRIITYAFDKEDGTVISRVGGEVAVPVLDYEGMTPANGFEMHYDLEKFPVYSLPAWDRYEWTKKIPVELKNRHRAFWGFSLLKATEGK